MRFLKLLLLVTVMGLWNPAFAQTDEDIMQMSISELETNRQAIMTTSMRLDEAASEKFWPAYRAYRADVEPLKQRYLDIVKSYADNYMALTDEQAAKLTKDYLKLEADKTSIRKKHVKKMQKAVGNVAAMRFLQIENKMDAVVDFGLAVQIPLAE